MQSSKSRFQRLSQTPLSRPRFLRLAAGALLPFVGLRLSAAAAPNPELAQNSGAPGTKALQGYDTITIGHDTPVHRSAIDSTIAYVKRAKEIHAASADAKTYSESLKAAFPNRRQAAWVDFSASLLYPAPR
jgi:hypothetical protein